MAADITVRMKGIFRYLDEDKLVPWLEAEIERYKKAGGHKQAYAYAVLIDRIHEGFFCFQQGSE